MTSRAGARQGEPVPIYDGRDHIGWVSESGRRFAALDADDGYVGTFEHRIDAIRALRDTWRVRRIRVGAVRT